jgi:moderate conductance mechanosensitive channel
MWILLRALVIGTAIVAVATAWNTGVLEWLRSDTGIAVVGLAARLGLIVGITIVAIEIVSILAGRVVNAKDDQNKPLHSNRVRTLATIFANIFYFIFGLAGLFLALSNVGVETAPLLAGAGVVGLAIGFGSQALVKDLITGLFILLGDTIRVGDVIDIAGKSGVVEGMSMRTISLRSYDGNVHTIPYGSIDVVTNMTKEFSFALLDIEIAYKENTDEVIRVIREIDDRLRKEWPYRRLILEPIDVAGVDQFEKSAVRLRMRSKTRPGEQWGIRREFLRRIKLRFDELGIEIPYPHQTVYFGTGKDGTSPPLRIQTMSRELREVPPESDMAAGGQEALSAPGPQGLRPATVQAAPVAANQGRRGGD